DNNLQIPEDTFQVTTRSLQETEELNTETLQKPKEQLQDEEQQITFSANLIKHRMELTKEEILVREAEKSLAQDEINIVQEVECLNLRDQFQKTEPCNAQTNDDSEEESMNLLQQESSLDQPRNLAQYEEPNNSLRDIYVKEKSLPQLKDEDLQTYPLNEEIFTAMEDLISGNVKMFQSQTFEEDIHFQTMVDLYRDRTREEHCEQIDHSNEEVEQNQETYNNSTQDKLKLISSTFSGENAEYAEEKITTKLFDTTES
ncbi:hypothetical protein XELAEV_18001317mg, partial [Xenopus laevis]